LTLTRREVKLACPRCVVESPWTASRPVSLEDHVDDSEAFVCPECNTTFRMEYTDEGLRLSYYLREGLNN
jgi:transposase-like protein